MNIPIEKIIEASTTEAISQITYDERVAIAGVYERLTNKVGKPLCNACLIQMCKTIINSGFNEQTKKETPKSSKQKNGNAHRGRG